MYKEWSRTTKYIVAVGLVIFAIFILYISRSLLPLLIFAGLIAFLVRPVINYLQRKAKFPRGIAVLVTYILVILVILLAPLVLVPPVIDAVSYLLGLDYQVLIDNILTWSESTLVHLKTNDLRLLGFSIILDSVIDPTLIFLKGASPEISPQLPDLSTFASSLGQAFAVSYGVAVGVVGTVISGFVAMVFLVLASIYFSVDGPKFISSLKNTAPKDYRLEVTTLIARFEITWDAFLRGQITLMFLIGFLVWLGLTLLGLPGAFALGLIAGVLEIIPNIGPFLAAIPAVIVALIQGSEFLPVNNLVFALIIILFYVLVNFLENTIVVPRVMGRAVKLHPLLVITGVLIGASVWGILGALLAAPVIATFREIILYLYRRVQGLDPFPTEEIEAQVVEPSLKETIVDIKTKAAGLVGRDTGSSSKDTEDSKDISD